MINLIQNGDFRSGVAGWRTSQGSIASDSTVFDVTAPSLKSTCGSVVWSGAMSPRFVVQAGHEYSYSARVKSDLAGLKLFAFIDYYSASGYIGGTELDFTGTGDWQSVSGEDVALPGAISADFGVYFWDNSQVGRFFNLDNVFFGDATVSTDTPFQPTLPAEAPFTDAEEAFIDESPENLFAENQNSNVGQFRKVFTDRVDDLTQIEAAIFSEIFIKTSSQYLDQWELEMALPVAPTALSVDQRRKLVSSRFAKGIFTHERVQDIVENYISATFGSSLSFGSLGIAMAAAGVPLFADTLPLSSSYRIYYNPNTFSYDVWIVSSVTPDVATMTRELQRITPAGMTMNLDNSHANILDYNRTIKNLSPIAYYKMNNLNDSSGYGNTGVASGGVTAGSFSSLLPGAGFIGGSDNSTNFDGVDDFFGVSQWAGLASARRFSMGCWCQPDTVPGVGVNRTIWGSDKFVVAQFGTALTANATVNGVATPNITTTTGVALATTTKFVGISYDGHKLRLYVDGVKLVESAEIPGESLISTTGITIGAGVGTYFDGKVDEWFAMNRALSDAEWLAVYNTGINVA